MTITTTTLTRGAAAAAVGAGLIFIGVQINHPHLDAVTVTSTEMAVRSSLKVVMAGLALFGITGLYVRQIKQTGVVGLVGYLLLATGYFLVAGTAFVAAFVLPSIAATNPAYVNDVIAEATGGHAVGDVGLLHAAILLQSVAYLAGGLIFGIALYRARVVARWAAALLAVGGVVSAALSLMPDAFYRLLAFPNGIAMIGLGCSLWATARAAGSTGSDPVAAQAPIAGPRVTAAVE
jgi:hypothetical protein